eukprot:m.40722 g.40722  ORF g.40722 m.40722 type:complete len:105 (-) comp6017_c0_seq1:685-999(-)
MLDTMDNAKHLQNALKVAVPPNMKNGSLHQNDHILASWHAGVTRTSPDATRKQATKITARSAEQHRSDEQMIPEVKHETISHTGNNVADALMACAEAHFNGEWA